MESAVEITRLCAAWQEQLSVSTRHDQQRYAEQFLTLLGWGESRAVDVATKDASLSSVSYILRSGSEGGVIAHFTMPGSLESPGSLVERGLDFCESTRLLVNGARRLNIGYAFITDFQRSYLYDVQLDELLLHADSPQIFEGCMPSVLSRAAIERGALEELRRAPRSQSARQLQVWCHHWLDTVQARLPGVDQHAPVLIDRLLVLRYLFDHDIMKRPGWRLRQRFSDLVAMAFGPNTRGCGKALSVLFHDIWVDWKAELFQPIPDLDAVLEADGIAGPMLREFALLSKSKFTIATILESFNYGEASEKARVRLVADDNEEREHYLAKQTADMIDETRLEVDVLEEGYRAIFKWFDRLLQQYEYLSVAFDRERTTRALPEEEMDLFSWSAADADRPQALKDRIHHVVEQGLCILYANPRQYRTARLMMYLHIICCYEQTKQRFTRFPAVEAMFEKRPTLLESEKPWLNPHRPRPVDEHWDVV